jgi:hypothetical protein
MVPRTANVNEMVTALLASPFVGYRSALDSHSQIATLERITQSIDSLKDVPPAVAIAVVNDIAMATKISEETDPAVVEQIIEQAVTAKAAELESQLTTAADRIVEAEQVRDAARADRVIAEQERDRLKAERDLAVQDARYKETKLERARESHRDETQELRGRVGDVEQRLRGAENERREANVRRRRLRRNAAAVAGCVLVDAAGATLMLTSVISGLGDDIATIIVMAIAIYIAVRVVSRQLATEVVALIGIVSLIVGVGSLVIATKAQSGESQNRGLGTGSPGHR